MFFSTYVLTRKGPLAQIWLAAHWDKKLTKNDVRVIDLNQTVVQIVNPSVPIALRTSGELMLGVVRIYSHKVRHLLKEATEATQLLVRPKVIVVKGAGGKESAVAVTLEITTDRLGAEQACGADFADIADILVPEKAGGKAPLAEGWVSDWFQAEPSQFQDLAKGMSQDDISRMKAELLGFDGHRDASSATSGSKKSSAPSIEKPRDGSKVLPPQDELDIGMPFPEELLDGTWVPNAEMHPDDVFALPGLRTPTPHPVEEEGILAADEPKTKRIKTVNILDQGNTVLDPSYIKKIGECQDILTAERRHGPRTEREAEDRLFVRDVDTHQLDGKPTCGGIPPHLAVVYEKAVGSTMAKVREQAEQARGLQSGDMSAPRQSGAAMFMGDAPLDEVPPFDMPLDFDVNAAEVPELAVDEPSSAKKRQREKEGQTFSASTIQTLEALRKLMKRTDDVSFKAFAAGKKRQETARTFVDCLVLASHGNIEVHQDKPYADIRLKKTVRLSEALPTA
jgi:cohesin complex subunit SCC1